MGGGIGRIIWCVCVCVGGGGGEGRRIRLMFKINKK